MADNVYPLDPSTLIASTDAARSAAAPYAAECQSRQPYRYGCIDNFLPPEVLIRVREELAQLPESESSFDRSQERLKTSYMPERLEPCARQMFTALTSKAFLAFLEEMTGIPHLIPDPYYSGGGIHRIGNGGHLDIHADFNHHGKMDLERRINVLIYLNPDWKEEYDGSFAIWDKKMENRVASFVPIFNRMCIFSTGSDTYHGNPETVNHPDGEPRLSIALYCYTATWGPHRKAHTTLFKPRLGTEDKVDRVVARRQLLRDLLPPILHRRLAGPLSRLGF